MKEQTVCNVWDRGPRYSVAPRHMRLGASNRCAAVSVGGGEVKKSRQQPRHSRFIARAQSLDGMFWVRTTTFVNHEVAPGVCELRCPCPPTTCKSWCTSLGRYASHAPLDDHRSVKKKKKRILFRPDRALRRCVRVCVRVCACFCARSCASAGVGAVKPRL